MYIGALTIVLLVAISTFSSLWLVDHVNHKQHEHRVVEGILSLVKQNIKATNGDLSYASQLLDTPLTLTPLSQAPLSFISKARLQQGQPVLAHTDSGGVIVQAAVEFKSQHYLLKGVFSDIQATQKNALIAFVQQLAQDTPAALTDFIARYSSDFAFPMRMLPKDQAFMSTEPQGRTNASIYLPQTQQTLEISPLSSASALSIHSILVVIALAIMLTGITVYWLVYRFEVNLQRLERAATRIAAGHLNSRVKVESQDALGRLGESFNRMAKHIQRLMGVQKEMIRAVSHELRTPIARMRFGVQMLEDTSTDQYTQKQLHEMDQDLQELDELVDEILTYARLEEGGPVLEFKATNMLDLVAQIVDETRRRTDKVEINWHSQTLEETTIFSDVEYRYMHRAIQNLVGNACRYAKGQVWLEYSFDNGICRVDVEDDGEGIPEQDWQRVFSPFTRLDDSRTRASGGYGLGLSIVQRIIFWHGGQAFVNRSRWQGAKMSLLWPQNHQAGVGEVIEP